MKGRDILIATSILCEGDFFKMMDRIKNRKAPTQEEVEVALASVSSNVVTIIDPDYPECFKSCSQPPLVLYYYGDLSLASDSSNIAGYIGSREASPYGLEMARYFGEALVDKGVIVVSGMARGIDSAVAEAVLDKRGKTIAVLGSGIDHPYPMSSKDIYRRIKTDGLILSEYPNDVPPKPDRFPARNRIIAALGSLLIVGEASLHSGSLVTVGWALSYGKEVGAIPFQATQSSGTNQLIRDGAHLIDNADDLDAFFSSKAKEE